MGFCSSVLMCHAPIVIPLVAGERAAECASTTQAMQRMARVLLSGKPDVVIVVSPHAARHRTAFGLSFEDSLYGDFARFGAPNLRVELPGAASVARSIATHAHAMDVACEPLDANPLDHGSAVPLHFVVQAGWRGPTLVASLPALSRVSRRRFGEVLAEAAKASGQRWALLASGDMSHRLAPGAPGGFHPDAVRFDREVVSRLGRGDVSSLSSIDKELRKLAAEDVVDSVEVASAATLDAGLGACVDHYAGPFGVGYCEAVLFDAAAAPRSLLDVARRALQAYLEEMPWQAPRLDPPWDESRGVFVTLRERGGALRGCVGRLMPTRSSLVEEVAHAAVSAGVHDPRFSPVTSEELDRLSFEVSVLGEFEPVADIAVELDPARYGIVVSGEGRQGVLLPNVPGIDSVAEQLRIARDKARLSDTSRVSVQRFEVKKVAEAPAKTFAS